LSSDEEGSIPKEGAKNTGNPKKLNPGDSVAQKHPFQLNVIKDAQNERQS
jgi:hypothetical protein